MDPKPHLLTETVFPSTEQTIAVQLDDTYGGAHTYIFRDSLGFANGQAQYGEGYSEIHFVQKDLDGTMKPGVLSEQVVIALIDRHRKLDAAFPSPHNQKAIAGLQQFLDAQRERVEERINRGVMGDLKQ